MSKIILILGVPGAGKGTQAELLKSKIPLLKHVSTGELLRAAVARQDTVGKTIDALLKQGSLVPDEMAIDLIRRFLLVHTDSPILLDGFPRTATQAHALHDMLTELKRSMVQPIFLQLPTDRIMDRLTGRQTCERGHIYHSKFYRSTQRNTCGLDGTALRVRNDDKPEVIKKRLAQQLPLLNEVIEYYTKSTGLKNFDATEEASLLNLKIASYLKQHGV